MKKKIINALLERYKKYKQSTNDTSLEHCIKITHQMLRKSKYCFLVSHGEKGWCNARLVQPIIDIDDNGCFTIWIGTRNDSRKVEELWLNPKTTITFENSRQDANLVVYGTATVETDPQIKSKHCWKNEWRMFFPYDPKAEEYIALKIEPSRIEIVSFSKNIIPEPFGLKSAVLVNHHKQWQLG